MATQSHRHALDTLEASVKTILLHTGSVFSDPSNFESGKLVRTSTQLRLSLPPALSRFHDALDELERDLIRARAVLHQGLVNDRARQLSGAVAKNAVDPVMANGHYDGDVDMADDLSQTNNSAFAKSPPHPASVETGPLVAATASNEAKVEEEDARNKPALPAPTSDHDNAANLAPEASAPVPKPEPVKTENPPDPPVLQPDVHDTVSADQQQQAPFATSAEESDNPSPDDLFDNSIFGTPGTNTGANLTPNDSTGLSNVDVNSLLPGLEFYANDNGGGGDSLDAFTNLPDDTTGVDFLGGDMDDGTAGGMAREQQGQARAGDANMTFDDFFANFGGDSGEGLASAPPAEGEQPPFDDSFFNLDP